MTWRTVVISKRSKLFLKMGHMIVRDFENNISRIYLKDISHIIVTTTEASITLALMNEIQKQKIKLIICDEKGNPSAELSSYYNSYNSSEKIRAQIMWSSDIKGEVWKRIVEEKIKNQMHLLKSFRLEKSNLLEGYLGQVEIFDSTNREAHAAKVYFNSLFGNDFSRNDDTNLNANLNYGYSIILSAINRCVVSMGYLTQLGIFHENIYNQFNLSSDLIEPRRPMVDREVLDMDYNRFEKYHKKRLINLLNKKVKIDEKEWYFNQACHIYCKSIVDALNNKDTSTMLFPAYEL